ncbi:MAG: 4a-hydroxytetrahydrobiopterin dehydratase [Luteimonas sp.]
MSTSQPAALAQAHCIPRKGAEYKLAQSRIDALLPQIPDWKLAENGAALTRTFKFEDYYRTMSFVNALAHMANREDHHPDLGVHYGRCEVRYSTHDVGGLSENDFVCAAKADLISA